MKLSMKILAGMLIAGSLYACNDSANTTSSDTDTASTKMDNMAASDAPARMDNTNVVPPVDSMNNASMAGNDQESINFLVTKNAKEMAWLQAGVNKSSSKDLKDHAAMMLKDHKKMDAEVKSYLAKHTNLSMPVAPDLTNEVNIDDKKGKEWDKAWLDKMDAAHKEVLSKLQGIKSSATDEELKKMATKNIPVIESHIDMIAMCQKKM